MKKFNLICKSIVCVLIGCSLITPSLAHSGGTDSKGGHRDNKNKSGLGYYHYHHGYTAHSHNNGCQYGGGVKSSKPKLNNNKPKSNNSSSKSNSTGNSDSSNVKVKEVQKKEIYSKGYRDGSDGKIKCVETNNLVLKSEYEKGYYLGLEENLEELKQEYTSLGEKDATNFDSKRDLSGDIVDSVELSYNLAYDSKIEAMKESIEKVAFTDSLLGTKKSFDNFANQLESDWYNAEYQDGDRAMKLERERVFMLGFNEMEYIPDSKFDIVKESLVEVYNDGVDAKRLEIRICILRAVFLVGLVGIIIFLVKYSKRSQ